MSRWRELGEAWEAAARERGGSADSLLEPREPRLIGESAASSAPRIGAGGETAIGAAMRGEVPPAGDRALAARAATMAAQPAEAGRPPGSR